MVKSVSLREAWAGEADCRNCALRTAALFGGLTEADFDQIHDPIDQYDVKPGTALYKTGDVGDYMYTVRSGSIKLVQYLPDGSQRIVRIVRGCDVLGLDVAHVAYTLLLRPAAKGGIEHLPACVAHAAPPAVIARFRAAEQSHRHLLTRTSGPPSARAGGQEKNPGRQGLPGRIGAYWPAPGRNEVDENMRRQLQERVDALRDSDGYGAWRESLLAVAGLAHFLLDIPNLRRIAED